MSALRQAWLNLKHGHKFTKKGKGCRFTGRFMEVEGHIELGDYCRFRNNVILRTNGKGKIVFGNRSGCSYYVFLEATNLIQIGNFTAIAEFTVIRDTNHLVYGTDMHFRQTPLIAAPVIIGDNVLIGSRCYINPGVTIGDGAVVNAGSVVTKNIGPLEVWAGVPARCVGHRTENVPPEKLMLAKELIARYGIKDDRHLNIDTRTHVE